MSRDQSVGPEKKDVVPPPPANVGVFNMDRWFTQCRQLGDFGAQLNATPATAVISIMAALSLITSYILNQHVIESVDHRAVFLIGSYVVLSSYFLIYYFLEAYSSSFQSVSHDKRFYTISNLIKSGMLAAMTPQCCYYLYHIIMYDQWNTTIIRNMGTIYCIPDFVSLLVVRRMQWTTIFHHLCVCAFNYASLHNDYSEENVCRLIVVYAVFSTFAYSVNMLLASRFLGVTHSVRRIMSAAAMVVYVICCCINWSYQVYYGYYLFTAHPHWSLVAYFIAIVPVVYDDITLNRWLYFNFRRVEATKED